ncbi:MAG: ribonuclease HI family protein [Patescibacteria group bacterium]
MSKKKIVIYTDGGARGNPGPAAIGVVFPDLEKEYGEQIGIATNNIAEYKAVIFGLKKAKQLLKDEYENIEIEVRSDSELLVHQMNGKYRVKNENLKHLYIETQNLLGNFKNVIFVHIPREKNKEADKMVNSALDPV